MKKMAASKMSGFVAAIADQVKNPVSSVLVAMDFFEQEFSKRKNGEVINYAVLDQVFHQLRSRLHALNSYVDELSGFAKPVNLNLQTVKAHAIASDVICDLKKNALWRGNINLVLEDPTTEITCDQKILKQVFRSVFLNSIESVSSTEGLRIEVEVIYLNSGVRLIISDSGPGVDPANIEKICEPFFTTKDASTGLGLALAKRYIEAHGGELLVKGNSRLGGAEISIFLPANKQQSEVR